MLKKKKINVQEVIKKFDINLANADQELIYRDIHEPAIKRLGLELSNIIDNTLYSRNIISWGTSESHFFKKIGKENTLKTLRRVLKVCPPLIMLSRGVSETTKKWIIQIANEFKIPVFVSKRSTSTNISLIGTFLSQYYSEETQVHGCLVLIGGVGVLIVGPSGSGKSEATLELIQRGHIFVSDDAVILKHFGASFYGKSPYLTKNFIEVRGIGLIDVKYTYGIKSIIDTCEVNLVVELVNQDSEDAKTLDRLGIEYLKYPVLDGHILKTQIPVKNGSSAASLIEAAVSAYLARKDGLDILEEIQRRRENE